MIGRPRSSRLTAHPAAHATAIRSQLAQDAITHTESIHHRAPRISSQPEAGFTACLRFYAHTLALFTNRRRATTRLTHPNTCQPVRDGRFRIIRATTTVAGQRLTSQVNIYTLIRHLISPPPPGGVGPSNSELFGPPFQQFNRHDTHPRFRFLDIHYEQRAAGAFSFALSFSQAVTHGL